MRMLPRLLMLAALPLAQAVVAQTLPAEPQAAAAPAEDLTEAAPQISTPRDKGLVEEQVSPAGTLHQGVAQIARTAPTAQPPQPLSDRSQGRTAAIEAVKGKDRCDPQADKDKRTKICSDVIESRADEFRRPTPTELSPEQRLLLARQIEGGGKTVADATRRLADTGTSENDVETMGIAATVLQQSQPPAKPDKETDPKIDAATQAIINAILVNPSTPQ